MEHKRTPKTIKTSTSKSQLPDDVNILLQLRTKLSNSKSANGESSTMLGTCTTVLSQDVVDRIGSDLQVICDKCGIQSANTALGYVLYGSVTGLQLAENIIHGTKKAQDLKIACNEKESNKDDSSGNESEDGSTSDNDVCEPDDEMDISDNTVEKTSVDISDNTVEQTLVEKTEIETTQTELTSYSEIEAEDLQKSNTHSLHVCVFCKYYGYTKSALQRHTKRFHKKWLCDHCIQCYDTEELLHKHTQETHQENITPKKKTPNTKKSTMSKNVAKSNKCKMYQCQFCKTKLPTSKLLEIHMKKVHNQEYTNMPENSIKIEIVDMIIKDKRTVKECKKKGKIDVKLKPSDTNCMFCEFEARDHDSLVIHLETCKAKLEKKRFTVDETAEMFDIPLDLLEDAIVEFPDLLKHSSSCSECGYISTKQGVSRHTLRAHGGPANIPCKYCKQKFRKDWELKTHMKSHFDKQGFFKVNTLKISKGETGSGGENGTEYTCDICGLALTKASLVEVHKMRHHFPERGYQCIVCLLVFADMNALKTHILYHFTHLDTGKDKEDEYIDNQGKKIRFNWQKRPNKKGFLCEQCGSDFKTDKTLQNHRPKCPGLAATYKFSYTDMGYNEEELMKAADLYPVAGKYIHKCPHCTYVSTLKGIEKHVIRSHRKKKITCGHCPRTFARGWQLKEHMKISHRDKKIQPAGGQIQPDGGQIQPDGGQAENKSFSTAKIATCEECEYVCAKRGMSMHMLHHKQDWNLSCVVCKKNASTIEMLAQHLAAHFDPGTGRLIVPRLAIKDRIESYDMVMFADDDDDQESNRLCEECGMSFPNVSKLRYHMKSHVNDRVKNMTDNVVYVQEQVVNRCDCPGNMCVKSCPVTMEIRQIKKYQCPYEGCPSMLGKACLMVKHIEEVHSGRGPLSCDECGKQYTHEKNLKVHIRKAHDKELNYPCPICDKRFFDSSKLKYHMVIHKPRSERTDLSACKICGKVLLTKYLKQHENSHTGKRPYKCMLCPSSFPYMTGLNRHMLHIHSKSAPYVCKSPGCGKAFKVPAKLKYHMTIHTGESKHRCEQCNKVFTQLSSLKKHKQYHCIEQEDSTRNMGLASMDSTEEHTQPREQENQQQLFMCSVCSALFTDYSTVEAHISSHDTPMEQAHISSHDTPIEQAHISSQTTHQDEVHIDSNDIPMEQEIDSNPQGITGVHQEKPDLNPQRIVLQQDTRLVTITAPVDHNAEIGDTEDQAMVQLVTPEYIITEAQ